MAIAVGVVLLTVQLIETSSGQPHKATIIDGRATPTPTNVLTDQSNLDGSQVDGSQTPNQEPPIVQLPPESSAESAPESLSNADPAPDPISINKGLEEAYEPPSITYFARHKHRIGGCDGQIQLRSNDFRFVAGKHALRLSRQEIKRTDGPGFVDMSGKKWHFRFDGKSDEEATIIFGAWFNNQPITQ
jgi:hypothetical protein